MGMKKPWIYDSNIPATLAEELNAEGIERPSSPGVRASFEEKQKAMEKHSLTASGDLVSEKEREWTWISVAARTSQLRTRMRKLQAKSRRSSSTCLREDARSELGLSDYRACSSLGKAGEAKDREMSRRFSYPATRYPSLEDKTAVSEPIIINTVDDLLRHLEKIGRLPPTVSSVPDTSPTPSVTGSETEVESGDSSFESVSSIESEDGVSENEAIIDQTPGEGTDKDQYVRSGICSPHKPPLGFPSNRLGI
ncbi:hypothetical protein ACEPAG_3142 [Sanghuangporus baumii]